MNDFNQMQEAIYFLIESYREKPKKLAKQLADDTQIIQTTQPNNQSKLEKIVLQLLYELHNYIRRQNKSICEKTNQKTKDEKDKEELIQYRQEKLQKQHKESQDYGESENVKVNIQQDMMDGIK